MRWFYILVFNIFMANLIGQTTDSIYIAADIQPIFPGCDTITTSAEQKSCSTRQLYSWIFRNLKYPEVARVNNVTGTVVVSFVINKDGSVNDPKILKSPDKSLSTEGLKLIERMKKKGISWSPAKKDNLPVRYRYVLPIKFQLGPSNSKELFLVFKAWKGVEVFRGMVPSEIQDKIPGNFIKTIETLDFQKSKAIYNVIGKAHIVNFRLKKLARPQELKGLKPSLVEELGYNQVRAQYIPSADQINLSIGKVPRRTTYLVHNYIGDIIHQGRLGSSNGHLEKIDASHMPNGVIFISLVRDQEYATVLVVKE